MSQTDNTYKLSIKGLDNPKWHGKQEIFVKAAMVYTLPISVSVDPYELKGYMNDVTFSVEQVSPQADVKIEHESRFFNKR